MRAAALTNLLSLPPLFLFLSLFLSLSGSVATRNLIAPALTGCSRLACSTSTCHQALSIRHAPPISYASIKYAPHEPSTNLPAPTISLHTHLSTCYLHHSLGDVFAVTRQRTTILRTHAATHQPDPSLQTSTRHMPCQPPPSVNLTCSRPNLSNNRFKSLSHEILL